ncbi:YecA family protein, partial [Syntrophaceticus schinkii]|uniref:YecA family protein n=1 Tax=Syntrophaceticus schinkii TaxID=499207 RepID=UPI00069B6F1C
MTESKLDIERILGYVNGLLYFCGVMDLESLYRAVADRLGGGLSRPYFKNILDEELKKDDTPYDFILDDGLYCHYDVENPHWILDEQGKRAEIPYRPVTDKEVHQVVNKQYSSLWHPTVKTLSRQLQEQFGYTKDDAMMKVLLGQTMLNNGMPHLQLVEYFLYDLEFDSFDELQPFINLVNGMANNTPQWILRGWTSFEVFERYEKHNLQPLPEPPFDFMGSRIGGKATPKVGRNEPCPCGSGKKYKKCCGASVTERDGGKAVPEDDEAKIPPAVNGAEVVPLAEKRADIGQKPSFEEWRALYEAAAAFKDARCWEWMHDNDLFGVMNPETGEIAYCCIMGELGEQYALGAYLGPEGLKSILDMMEGPDSHSTDLFFVQKCLMASFDNREDLEKEDRAVIKELGLKFRGKNQWPQFRSYEPGLYPWFIDAWECRFLTIALQQAIEVSLRCRSSKAILVCDQPNAFLVRVPSQQGEIITWLDRYLEPAPVIMKYVAFEITNELLLKKILTSGKRKQAVWEVDTFFAPFPVQEKKGERPYFPKTFLILDSKTGLILGHEMVKDISEEGYHCIQCLTDLMVDSKIPSRILV